MVNDIVSQTSRASAPPKRTFRRLVRIAHLWTGLILGLWLVMLGLWWRGSAKWKNALRFRYRGASNRARILLRPLHVGTVGGNFTRVLWILFDLSPAILFVTGFLLWPLCLHPDERKARYSLVVCGTQVRRLDRLLL
jgi:uncharacterized iron-regulated membrane protein